MISAAKQLRSVWRRAQVSSLRSRGVLAPRAVRTGGRAHVRGRSRMSADARARPRLLAHAMHAPDDGRRAFLTTLAAVSFANDEIVDSRHYRPSTRFNVIIINIIFLLRTKRYLRLFGI